MKRIFQTLFLILLVCIFTSNISYGFEEDYRQIYLDLQMPDFSYMHDIDPGQYYDNKNSAYTPYPLFRLTSALYCKKIVIQPGYYQLTPVNYKGGDYILFKQLGLVRHIIPVYKKEFVPVGFYETHLPQPKLTPIQKMSKNFYTFIGNHFSNSQRKPPVQAYLEVNDLDNKFVSIIVYYGDYRYYTIFRTVQL